MIVQGWKADHQGNPTYYLYINTDLISRYESTSNPQGETVFNCYDVRGENIGLISENSMRSLIENSAPTCACSNP